MAEDLPLRPSGGNRRHLDELWLWRLEERGLQALLPQPPRDAPPELHRAIEEFNSGAFWDCHETLEDPWRETTYPLRFFYHAIIKTAVGFHHLGRHNRHGARVKLGDGVRLLRVFSPDFMGVRVGRLRDDVLPWLSRVEGAGRVDWLGLDAMARPVIGITPESGAGKGDAG